MQKVTGKLNKLTYKNSSKEIVSILPFNTILKHNNEKINIIKVTQIFNVSADYLLGLED